MTTNTKTLLTVKIDKKLKLQVQKFAEEMGIPLGTLINAILKHLVRTKTMIFSLDPAVNQKYTDSLLKISKSKK